MKYIIIIISAILISSCAPVDFSIIEKKYDKFKNITTYTNINPDQNHNKYKWDGAYISFTIWYECIGDTTCVPEYVSLMLSEWHKDWVYMNNQDFIMLIDGVKFTPKKYEKCWDGTVGVSFAGNNGVQEYLFYYLTPQEIKSIIEAKNIECQINTTEFTLSEHNIDAFKGIYHSIYPNYIITKQQN